MRIDCLTVAFCLSLTVYATGYHEAGRAIGETARWVVVSNVQANGATGSAGNRTQPSKDNDKKKCAEISGLTKLAEFASNGTKLAELQKKANLTAAEIQKIKSEAVNATAKLAQLKSNTTLANECATINAAQKLKERCLQISALTKLTQLASNATALQQLQAKRNLTTAEMQKIKDEAANATVRLQKLQANGTLTKACTNLKAGKGSNGTKTAAVTISTATPTSGAPRAARSVSTASDTKFLANGAFAIFISTLAVLLMI